MVTSAGGAPGRTHADVARAAVEGGATAVQLRAPDLDEEALTAAARRVGSICRERGVLFVVNDSLEAATVSGADGVHLGQRDDPYRARDALGPDMVLGISVEDPEQSRRAEEAGADYLGVTVWATATKPGAIPHGLEGVREVVAATGLPVIGIGGIHAGNAGKVLAAGAAGVAVVSAVGAAADPVAATLELAAAVGLS